MKTIILLPSLLCLFTSGAWAQGPLAPPAGTPAPTMRSLDQIEPRTPILTVPFTISTAGHYYLTKSVSTTTGGITVDADDVVLDLGGFTLSGDGGGSDSGVLVTTQNRVTIRNGTVRGFGLGVQIAPGSAEVVVEDIIATGNSTGVFGGTSAGNPPVVRCVFRRVRAIGNTNSGIFIANGTPQATIAQNLVDHCEAINNGPFGIQVFPPGNLIINCLASGNTTNYNIAPNNRLGAIVAPAVNAAAVNGSSGGPGTGTSDPFANVSF